MYRRAERTGPDVVIGKNIMEKEGFDLHSERIKGDTFVDRKRDKKKVF